MKSKWILGILILTVSALVGCTKEADLSEHKSQYSYAIGHQIATNMKNQGVDLDADAFSLAVKDVLSGNDKRMSEKDRRDAIRKMSEMRREKDMKAAEDNLKKGKDYLEANKARPGVKTTKSGLQYKVVKDGSGKKPKKSDVVEVHYRGKLIDGTEFDSSYKRNRPAEFPVDAVIAGWTEALQLMKTGSTWELTIPADLGYGERGNPRIPGNSVLIFEVELLGIKKK